MKNKIIWLLIISSGLCLPLSIGQTTKTYEFTNTSAVDANDFHFEITSGTQIKNASATYEGAECFPDKVFDPPSASLDWSADENTVLIPDGGKMRLKVEVTGGSERNRSGHFTRDGVEIGTSRLVQVSVALDDINPNEGYLVFSNEDTTDVILDNITVHIDNTTNPLDNFPDYTPDGVQYTDIPSNIILIPGEVVDFYYANNLTDSYLSINYNVIDASTEITSTEETVFYIPEPEASDEINILVKNETGEEKTDFHIVFKGDVRGGNARSWESDANDSITIGWASGSEETSGTYDPTTDETTVNYENTNSPRPNGSYAHFGYIINEGELKPLRMYWTPTTDPPAMIDIVPVDVVTIHPSENNATIEIQNVVNTYADGTAEPLEVTINYRVSSVPIPLENLSFSDPMIAGLPVNPLGSYFLIPDEPVSHTLNVPSDIQENEYLIVEVHSSWGLNANTTSYLAAFAPLAFVCPSELYLTGDIPVGTYHTANEIIADGNVYYSDTVEFKTGDLITLDTGFSVQSQADFIGGIEECVPEPIGYCWRCDVDNVFVEMVHPNVTQNWCNQFDGIYTWTLEEVVIGAPCPD